MTNSNLKVREVFRLDLRLTTSGISLGGLTDGPIQAPRPVLRDRPHQIGRHGDLEGIVQVGKQRNHPGLGERKIDRSQRKPGMPESIDPVSLAMGHRAGSAGPESQISSHQLDGYRRARDHVGSVSQLGAGRSRSRPAALQHPHPVGSQSASQKVGSFRRNPRKDQGRVDIAEQLPAQGLQGSRSGGHGFGDGKYGCGPGVGDREDPGPSNPKSTVRSDRGHLDHDGVAPHRLIRLLEDADHLLDRGESRHGLLGEGKGEGNGPNQPAVHVNRAPAHAAHHAGLLQGAPGKAGQNGVLAGSDVLEDS